MQKHLMEVSSMFSELILKGNARTGDQIAEWINPKVEEMNKKLENWDWSKPFTVELTEKGSVNEFERHLSGTEIPEILPEIGYFKLYKSSKITDFITGSFLEQYGLIVSDQAKGILVNFNIGKHKFYNLCIEHKGQKYNNFYFLKSLANAEDYIDFEKSIFYRQKGYFNYDERQVINIKSESELNNFRFENSGKDIYIFANTIFLKKDFPDFDYFTINDFGIHKKIITNRLAEKLKDLTGIEIKLTNQIFRYIY